MLIIGEALGGTNVGNCPHRCNEQPCGLLSECVPLLDTYECRCGQFSQECNKTSGRLPHVPSNTEYETKSDAAEASKPILPDRNNQQKLHNQYIKPYSKHSKSHHSQFQSTQFSSTNSISNIKHDYKLRKKHNPSERRNSNKTLKDKTKWHEHIRETPEVSSYETDSKDFATADMYINDTPNVYDFDLQHAQEAKKKEIQLDKNNLQPFIKEYPRVLPFKVDEPKPRKHLRKKHQRLRSQKDFDEERQKYQLGDNKHSLEMYKLDPDVFENIPVTDQPRKKIHQRPSHRCKSHRKHAINYQAKKPMHKALLSTDQTNKGIIIGDPLDVDIVDYHTKELFQDMKRIMKNSDSSPSTISTKILNSKKSENYESEPESERIVRKSLGACFTGTDSYFHYNDAETMSQIISYKIDLNLRIKTHSRNGVILWSGRQTALGNDDYLSLGIENGYLHLRYNLGSGEANVQFNTTKVSDGLWHRVRAIRNAQEGFLEVDGRKSVVQRSPGKLRQLNTDTGLYVGGMEDVSYFTRRRYSTGMVGCISEIILAGELKLNFDPATLGTAHNVETGIL